MKEINVRGKAFREYISEAEIIAKTKELADQITKDHGDDTPLFVGVLNGSFMFMAELMKQYQAPCEIGFIKAASYEGMESTGNVKFQGMGELSVAGRDIILVEDIVDTGNTLKALHEEFHKLAPKSVKICTLLFKKEAYQASLPINYVCFEVENRFLLGYGLDYDGLGRNTPSIYLLKEN